VCLVCWLVAGPNSRVYVFAHFTHAVVWVLYARVYGTHTSRGCEWFETCDMRPRRRNSRQYCCLDVQKIVPNKRKVLKIFHALTCCDAACGHTTPHHTTPHHTTPHHTTPHHTTPHHTTPHHPTPHHTTPHHTTPHHTTPHHTTPHHTRGVHIYHRVYRRER
jgi:hypothetical protein